MSAIQVRWLADHLSQGKISREEFASLYNRVMAEREQAAGIDAITARRRVQRLHPVTRRILAQIRVFKRMARVARYLLVIGVAGALYAAWSNDLQFNDDLLKGQIVTSLLSLSPAWVPSLAPDIRQATEQLAGWANWNVQSVNEFNRRWRALPTQKIKTYQGTAWYRGFELALALQIAEQRALAKTGGGQAVLKAQVLDRLRHTLERPLS